MPLYYFKCAEGHVNKRLFTVEKYNLTEGWVYCDSCNLPAQRYFKGGSSKAMEVLDNGFMARPVERLADAQRIFQERGIQNTLANRTDDQSDS